MKNIRIQIPARPTFLTEYLVEGLAYGGRVEAETWAKAQAEVGHDAVVVGRLAATYSGPAMSDAVANEILSAMDERQNDKVLS
ncbi:MAG: hypothetical protein HQL44_17110 [Alphaproteobacteria bacterium]|nr:hypothetical protein [Alphaproteobacteria bacterium]